jgi:hypothetical protein
VTESLNGRRDVATAELFAGPGEVRALARTLDWGATPVGCPESWSPALRIATRAMLDSPFPIIPSERSKSRDLHSSFSQRAERTRRTAPSGPSRRDFHAEARSVPP